MIFKDQYGKEHEVDSKNVEIRWRIAAYGVVFNGNSETLMIRPHQNSTKWQFPGGQVEIDESINDALKREFLEEVGYKIGTDEKKLLFLNEQNFLDDYNKSHYHSLQLLFSVTLEDEKQYEEFIERGEGMDYGEVGWIDINSLTENDVQHTHWPVVKLLQEKILVETE